MGVGQNRISPLIVIGASHWLASSLAEGIWCCHCRAALLLDQNFAEQTRAFALISPVALLSSVIVTDVGSKASARRS